VRKGDTEHGAVDLVCDGTDKTGPKAEYTCRRERGQDCASLIGRSLEPGTPEGCDQMSPFPVIVFCLFVVVDTVSEVR